MNYPLHRGSDGRWIHTWVRQSSVKTSDMCLERLRSDMFGLVPDFTGDAAALGTACHAVVEDALNARIGGKDETFEGMCHAFDHYWDEIEPTVERWYKYNRDNVRAIGYSRLEMRNNEVYPQVTPVAVEQNFNKIFHEDSERVIYLRGTIDLVEADCIWDWKFPSRDYGRHAWEYRRWDVQSIAYCWASEIQNFKFGVVHPDGVSYIELERDASHTEWLRQKVLALCQFVEKVPQGPWPLGDNGWWCSEKWCSNWARCKGATQEVANGL